MNNEVQKAASKYLKAQSKRVLPLLRYALAAAIVSVVVGEKPKRKRSRSRAL